MAASSTQAPEADRGGNHRAPRHTNCEVWRRHLRGDGRMLSGGEAYTRSVTHARAAPTTGAMHEGESRP